MDPSMLAQLGGKGQQSRPEPPVPLGERVKLGVVRYGPLLTIIACGLYFTKPKPTWHSLTKLPL